MRTDAKEQVKSKRGERCPLRHRQTGGYGKRAGEWMALPIGDSRECVQRIERENTRGAWSAALLRGQETHDLCQRSSQVDN